ncbi:prolyl 4-hydroxylase subunit alpha-2-like [Paramormyrops kingsleyae]|uniref:prolyl 4-hydroxylase subunit alpha-2-like n=1 Tax=Paramormyrops kingsleyae TaxID=1676925 RepID=UPI003B9760AF
MRLAMFFCLSGALFCIPHIQAEFYTSIGQMTELIFTERELVHSLKEYICSAESKLAFIKSWADKLDVLTQVSTADPEGYLAHPVNAYKLMKRLNSEWPQLETLVQQDLSSGFIANISLRRQFFPDDEDERGAARALFRLQDTYRLDSELLSSGQLPGVQYSSHLTADDCYSLGKTAYEEEDHYHSVLWMQEALRRLHTGEEAFVSQAEVLDYLSYSVYQMGDVHRTRELTRRLISADPTHERARGNLQHLELILSNEATQSSTMATAAKPITLETYQRPPSHLSDREIYEALCRGEGATMTPQRRSKLFCRYQDRGRNPRLLVAPMKEEDEWDSPHIVRYHDALSQAEIERIKDLAKPKLARATIRDPVSGVLTVANYRVSKSAWLEYKVDPVIARVTRRIADVTGLSLETAESLQVANYGIGGQYEPHYDFSRRPFDSDLKIEGNRLATYLNYLSDVEAGGATVFTDIGVALRPRQGTAVFWHNLHRSGKGDLRTRHAACPVLLGNKWVANMWIHERGQEFRRQCGLTEGD